MNTKGYEKLAELVVESLLDGDGSFEEFMHVLKSEAIQQSKDAHASADDYTCEELDAHERMEYEAAECVLVGNDVSMLKARVSMTKRHCRDFLAALDRGYFGSVAEIKDSAFVEPLRESIQ
jgi:hypothetical protein